jgi:hypothetical protein
MPGHPFIGSERDRGCRASEGNEWRRWCAIMVVEAAILGGDQPGLWWGVMRGGAPAVTGAERAPVGGVRACEAAAAPVSIGPGRKTIGRGPCVNERGRLVGWVGRQAEAQRGSWEGGPNGGEGRRERVGRAESWNRVNSRRKKPFSNFF